MCILFLITNKILPFGKFKLILASNRDEYYARPAAIVSRWKENPDTIGGRDMEMGREGGTWLAINTNRLQKIIKVGALLNVTGEKLNPNAKARGPIVANYINGDLTSKEYSQLKLNADEYNVYNFITVEISPELTRILYTSNAPATTLELANGNVHGLGNSPLKTPLRKVNAGEKMFDEIVNDETMSSKVDLIDRLLDLLKCRTEFWPDEELARRQPEWGQKLSHIHVKMAGYGTRTHTVILVDEQNNVDIIEVTMVSKDPDGEWQTTHLQSQL